jgi:hypothetical protein
MPSIRRRRRVDRGNICYALIEIDQPRLRALQEDDRFWSRVDRVYQTFSAGAAGSMTMVSPDRESRAWLFPAGLAAPANP